MVTRLSKDGGIDEKRSPIRKMEVQKGRTDLHQAQRKEGQRILLENEVRRSETVLSEIKDLIYSLTPATVLPGTFQVLDTPVNSARAM